MALAYELRTGVLYDEGLAQRAASWSGYDLVGLTPFPYAIGTDTSYPGATQGADTIRALILDTQAESTIYPRYKFAKDDTGRTIRFQITDGGAAKDISGYTAKLYSYKQSDSSTIRNGVDISTIGGTIIKSADGYIEWMLPATDTAQSFYYYITLTKTSEVWTLPAYGYLYADAFDHTSTAGYEAQPLIAAFARINAGDEGKAFTFSLRDVELGALNLESAACVFHFGKPVAKIVTPDTKAMTGESFIGGATFTIDSTRFTGGAGTYYGWIAITTRASKVIKVPTTGHIAMEVY
jgi:hypothetical protein